MAALNVNNTTDLKVIIKALEDLIIEEPELYAEAAQIMQSHEIAEMSKEHLVMLIAFMSDSCGNVSKPKPQIDGDGNFSIVSTSPNPFAAGIQQGGRQVVSKPQITNVVDSPIKSPNIPDFGDQDSDSDSDYSSDNNGSDNDSVNSDHSAYSINVKQSNSHKSSKQQISESSSAKKLKFSLHAESSEDLLPQPLMSIEQKLPHMTVNDKYAYLDAMVKNLLKFSDELLKMGGIKIEAYSNPHLYTDDQLNKRIIHLSKIIDQKTFRTANEVNRGQDKQGSSKSGYPIIRIERPDEKIKQMTESAELKSLWAHVLACGHENLSLGPALEELLKNIEARDNPDTVPEEYNTRVSYMMSKPLPEYKRMAAHAARTDYIKFTQAFNKDLQNSWNPASLISSWACFDITADIAEKISKLTNLKEIIEYISSERTRLPQPPTSKSS